MMTSSVIMDSTLMSYVLMRYGLLCHGVYKPHLSYITLEWG